MTTKAGCKDAPINITSTPNGTCELKCDYKFDYKSSNITLSNKTNYVQLSYDMASSPQVIYNSDNYQVREVRLYVPSIHRYNGSTADAELIIVHSSNSKNLIVSVPVRSSSVKGKTSRFLDQVADYVTKFAPNAGDQTSMGNATWNLNDFVPEKKFYSYSGTAPYSPCVDGFDYVVFDKVDAVDMTQDALNKIKRHIADSKIKPKSSSNKVSFYQSAKPAKNDLGTESDDDIYIACSPTYVDDKIIVVDKNEENAKKYNIGTSGLFGDFSTFKFEIPEWLKGDTGKIIGIVIGSIIGFAILSFGIVKLREYWKSDARVEHMSKLSKVGSKMKSNISDVGSKIKEKIPKGKGTGGVAPAPTPAPTPAPALVQTSANSSSAIK
jgi:carbonic anhydrase